MVCTSWNDVKAYANWISNRLPTEEEFKFSAQGIDGTYTTHDANLEGKTDKDLWELTTAPVGSLKPNDYGLYDMGGNASEWTSTSSWSHETTAVGLPVQLVKVMGGSWKHKRHEQSFLYTTKFNNEPAIKQDTETGSYCGFHCVSAISNKSKINQ